MVHHHGLAETIQAKLRCVVRGAPGKRISSCQAADVDNGAAFTALKTFKSFAAAVKRSGKIHSDHSVPFLDREFRGSAKNAHPRVVDQDVETTKLPIGKLKQLGDVGAVANVRRDA